MFEETLASMLTSARRKVRTKWLLMFTDDRSSLAGAVSTGGVMTNANAILPIPYTL